MSGVETLRPRDAGEVAVAVRSCRRVLAVGAGSKPPLSRPPPGVTPLSCSDLRGVVEYQPSEFTVTARAGTPLAELVATLAEQGQSLPFDPPFEDRGATLGGSVAAGLSGSGRQRYGGARDFLIGVAMVDGEGNLIRGGGKVVKNAAGFDLPKLMVGSLGALGVLVELTLKVFPRPRARTTLRFRAASFEDAHRAALALAAAPLELDALDLESDGDGDGWSLLARLGGLEESLDARARRVEGLVRSALGDHRAPAERLAGADEDAVWAAAREARWLPAARLLIRVPLPGARAAGWEADLGSLEPLRGEPRRYTAGGAVAWVAWPQSEPLDPLDRLLRRRGIAGQIVLGEVIAFGEETALGKEMGLGKTTALGKEMALGEAPVSLLGALRGLPFHRRLRRALDPSGRFVDLEERLPAPQAAAVEGAGRDALNDPRSAPGTGT